MSRGKLTRKQRAAFGRANAIRRDLETLIDTFDQAPDFGAVAWNPAYQALRASYDWLRTLEARFRDAEGQPEYRPSDAE